MYQDGVDCYYYVYSTCTRVCECNYCFEGPAHESPMQSRVYKRKGEACTYRHSEDVRTAAGFTKSCRPVRQKACIFFQQGKCTKGSSCPFYHAEATLDTALPGGPLPAKTYRKNSRPPITTKRTQAKAKAATSPPNDKQLLLQQQLKQFKQLLDSDLIAQAEYEQLKTSALATFGFGVVNNKTPAAKTQTQAQPEKTPAQKQEAAPPKVVASTSTQQHKIAPKANAAQVRKPPQSKPKAISKPTAISKPKAIVLKPAAARRSGISITRVVGGGRTIGKSAKKVLDKGDLKNRIRVQQSGSQPVTETRAKPAPRKLTVQPRRNDLSVLIKRKSIDTKSAEVPKVRKLVIGSSKRATPPKMVVTLKQPKPDKAQQRKAQEQNRLKQLRAKQLQQQKVARAREEKRKLEQQRQQQQAKLKKIEQQRKQQQAKLQQQLKLRKERAQQQKHIQTKSVAKPEAKAAPKKILNLSKVVGASSPKRKLQTTATTQLKTPKPKLTKIAIDALEVSSPSVPDSPALTPGTQKLFENASNEDTMDASMDLADLDEDDDLNAEVLAFLNQ